MGNDYYVTNEHRVAPDGGTRASGEVFGYDGITWQYYDRYRLPVMHTETNRAEGPNGDEAVDGFGRNGLMFSAFATTASRSWGLHGIR